MNKLALLLPIALLACGSEVDDGNKGPASDQTTTPTPGSPGAAGAAGADSIVTSNPLGSSHDHDIAVVTPGHTIAQPGGRGYPVIDPPSSQPSSDSQPQSDPFTVPDPSTTPTDPSPTPDDAGSSGSSGSCAPTRSGHLPNGKSKGSGSQGGEGSSCWSCGGPL
jgi:hypothetical protein